MKCEYCEKEVSEKDVFCSNCGARLKEELPKEERSKEEPKKKKMHPVKIFLIIFAIVIVVLGLVFGANVLLFKTIFSGDSFDDDTFEYYYSDDYDDIEDEFDKWFSKSFDDDDDDKSSVYDKSDAFGSYKSAENFVDGEISSDTNTYSSKFNGLSFQLPTYWEIYDSSDLNKLYNSEGISKSLVNSNLMKYDLYADNSFTNANLYICYYNAEYFSEYKDLDDFNELIKDETEEYASYNYTVDYAEDATITLGGEEYDMLAARISSSGGSVYQYDFTRLVNGYYMQISIFSRDTDEVGEIIDILNSKG